MDNVEMIPRNKKEKRNWKNQNPKISFENIEGEGGGVVDTMNLNEVQCEELLHPLFYINKSQLLIKTNRLLSNLNE